MSKDRPPFGVPGRGRDRPDVHGPTGATDEDEVRAARAANRFDIRRLIGGLFVLYAIVLVALGLFGSHQVKHKAAGIDIDLWAGLGMLVFGLGMIAWALLRPVLPEPAETRGQGSGRIRRAPAT
jgi:predicted MFS family arabinose efflux permease